MASAAEVHRAEGQFNIKQAEVSKISIWYA